MGSMFHSTPLAGCCSSQLNRGWLANPMPQSRAVMEIGLVSPPGCKIFLKYFLSFFFCDRTSRWSEIRLFLKCLLWVFSAEMGPRSNKKDRYLVIFFRQIPIFYLQGSFFALSPSWRQFLSINFQPRFFQQRKKSFVADCKIAKLQNVGGHLKTKYDEFDSAKLCRNWILGWVLCTLLQRTWLPLR